MTLQDDARRAPRRRRIAGWALAALLLPVVTLELVAQGAPTTRTLQTALITRKAAAEAAPGVCVLSTSTVRLAAEATVPLGPLTRWSDVRITDRRTRFEVRRSCDPDAPRVKVDRVDLQGLWATEAGGAVDDEPFLDQDPFDDFDEGFDDDFDEGFDEGFDDTSARSTEDSTAVSGGFSNTAVGSLNFTAITGSIAGPAYGSRLCLNGRVTASVNVYDGPAATSGVSVADLGRLCLG